MTTNTANMTYTQLCARQHKEFGTLPLGFACTDDGFDRMMRGWGLDPDADKDKIRSIGGGGCYIQTKDMEAFNAKLARYHAERAAAVAADPTGDGFIYQMFRSELGRFDHDFALDHLEDVLRELGYTAEDVEADPRLLRGLQKAAEELCAA